MKPSSFVILSLCFTFLVSVALSQTGLELHWEQENWTSDMKNVKMTTFDRGLIVRIDLGNSGTNDYLELPYLRIRIETIYEETDSKDWHYIELENIEIKSGETASFWHTIDFGHSFSNRVGKWSVRVAYETNKNSYDYIDKISPYPFEFTLVETEAELQRAIAENPAAPIINIYLPQITLVGAGGITLLVLFVWRKKRG